MRELGCEGAQERENAVKVIPGDRTGDGGTVGRSDKEMKRKTFVKQLMALGLSRNEANRLCREELDSMAKYRGSGLPVRLAWECLLAETIGQLEDFLSVNAATTWWTGTGDKLFAWQMKRSKEDPRRIWSRNNPNNM